MSELEAVLIAGVYGSGKSSAAVEIAYLLEQVDAPFVLLDLDFLSWFAAPSDAENQRVTLDNIAAVAANVKTVGVRFFVLAGSIAAKEEIAGLEDALGIPIRVVRLSVPLETIRDRLKADVTAGRRDDLAESAAQLSRGHGEGIEDLAVDNSGPIRRTAETILEWLGWPMPEPAYPPE